jgi:2-polyprenyl-6-hydroxyphenyl methylase/3-demethylubiquinone-9 3-methyltransferase
MIARERARQAGLEIDLVAGSATSLPWPDASFDIVAMPELLEHIAEWRSCLKEAARILAPGGILYISTTNRLCPVQQEYSLPLYSWYPGWLKRRCEALAVTTRRDWVNHATYPAVNWFDPYSLRAEFRSLSMAPWDRFDMLADYSDSPAKRRVGRLVRAVPPLRFLGHILSSGTALAGRKR